MSVLRRELHRIRAVGVGLYAPLHLVDDVVLAQDAYEADQIEKQMLRHYHASRMFWRVLRDTIPRAVIAKAEGRDNG